MESIHQLESPDDPSALTKRCPRCGEVKPLHDYPGSATKKVYCRPCWRDVQREWRERNPEKHRAYKRLSYERGDPAQRKAAARQRRWGLTAEALEEMLLRQGGCCAICPAIEPGGRGTWHIDHDHACCPGQRSCGRCVRGLLCNRCNVGLGQFRDDPALLASAIRYLSREP